MRLKRDELAVDKEFFNLIVQLLKKMGKDFTKCEQCGNELPPGKAKVHHTKYDGATLYDLEVICHKCNLKPENKGLT